MDKGDLRSGCWALLTAAEFQVFVSREHAGPWNWPLYLRYSLRFQSAWCTSLSFHFMLWEVPFGSFAPRSGQSIVQIQERELLLNFSNFNLDFYSLNVFLKTSDIVLKEILVGIYFIKKIPTSVLRKGRVLRLLGNTMNDTQQGSYSNCT